MEKACCCSVTKSCLTLCDPTDYSTLGFPVLHCLSLFKIRSTESVMPSNHLILCRPLLLLPLIFPSIRGFPMTCLVAKVLEFQLQHQSFQWRTDIQGWFPLGLTGLVSLHSQALSRVFSSTTVWKYQFWKDSFYSRVKSLNYSYFRIITEAL